MTFEKILDEMTFNNITVQEAKKYLQEKDNSKLINFYIHREKFSQEPLTESQLSQLNALVQILQMIYNSGEEPLIRDTEYDILQETLVNMGIPRLTSDLYTNSMKKESHKYTNLRGTLNKVYYLYPDDKRTNSSRKYLDEWIKSTETKYFKTTGEKIDLNEQKVCIQPKFDGASVILEIGKKMTWLTRGDTDNNLATDVSHIMDIFNNLYIEYKDCGIKFEVCMTEDNKDRINELFPSRQYKNSRQIVTATLNSKEPDFKADYLYPIPLRIMKSDSEVEEIHPDLIRDFPTMICKLSDRDDIKKFANDNKWVLKNGMRFRTDGVVITLTDINVRRTLGRENHINNFEVAFKATEEYAYSKVVDVEFEVGMFGVITPVVVFNDVILKGNKINRASLSNKARFDELSLCRGDSIKILYDIIPYVTLDEYCLKINGN